MTFIRRLFLALAMACTADAMAIEDLFERKPGDPLSGFQAVQDRTYQKECTGCHFVYLPGLLPARSWNG